MKKFMAKDEFKRGDAGRRITFSLSLVALLY